MKQAVGGWGRKINIYNKFYIHNKLQFRMDNRRVQ